MELHTVVGSLGAALIVASYLALQTHKVRGDAVSYSVANALGAAMILFSLYFDFNLSSFLIEIFWLAISLLALARTFLTRNEPTRSLTQEPTR